MLLKQQDDILAELYQHAIDMLSDVEVTRSRLIIGCHCLRELLAGLPFVMQDPVEPRQDVGGAARQLALAWEEAGLTLDTPGAAAPSDGRAFAVPVDVYETARQVASAAAAGAGRALSRSGTIVTGQPLPPTSPQLLRFHRASQRLPGRAHFRSYADPSAALPTSEQLEDDLVALEDGLRSRLSYFGQQVAAVDAVLAKANRRVSGAS